MKTITAEYSENLRCKIKHDISGSVIFTDAHKDGTSIGFTPPELFALSLLTCIATMMGYEAEALKLDLSGMKMEVGFEMANDKPKRIAKIATEFWIPCSVTDHQKELLMKVAHNCPVRFSIHPDIKESIKFHWQGDK